MDNTKTYKGIFWIPSEPDNYKNGLLKFLDKTAYVDLFDSFDKDPFNIKTKRRKEICCIYGVLDGGRCCILHKCNLSITGALSGLTSTLINFTYLFYSSNRDLIQKETHFDKIEFQINTLFHWGGENSIESNRDSENNLSLDYKSPEINEDIYEQEDYILRLNHTTSIPLTTHKKSLSIDQDTSLILELKKEKHDVLEGLNFIDKIHDFFVILHCDKVELKNIFNLSTPEDEFFYCYTNKIRFRNSKSYQSHEFGNLFTLDELKEVSKIDLIFKSWMSLYDEHRYTIELLTQSLSDIKMNAQHKFMNLIYGFEHLITKDLNIEIAKEFYTRKDKEILSEIESLIPEEIRVNNHNFFGKLKSRLESHRKLSDKFNAFFEQLEIPIKELFNEESEAFIDKVINTRNHFAHVNNKTPRIDLDELYLYNLKLEAILVFTIFKKLDIPTEKIRIKLKMHDRFQKIVR
jgi:hypothetical protein